MPDERRVHISLRLPLGNAGWVELRIDTPLSGLTSHDARFIIDVTDRVNEFARTVTKNAAPAEIPAVLRGVVKN